MALGTTSLMQLIGAQLRQGEAGRAAFICWMSSPPYLLLACWAVISQIVFSDHITAGLSLIALFGLSAATACSLMALVGYHPRVTQKPAIYVHVVLWAYGMLAVTACYLIGTLNLMTGMIMMAAPTIGLILFSARLILSVFLAFICALLILSALAVLNYVPYAPGLGIGFRVDPSSSLYFTCSMIIAAAGYVIYQTFILLALLNAWHNREQKVRHQSATDALTGVANRRQILAHLEKCLTQIQRHDDRIALLMLDIDHFKKINDSHGHQIGDQALISVAQALRTCMRANDMVGRYGGEEFLIILPGADHTTAEEIAQRCRDSVSSVRLALGKATLPITASIGAVSRTADTIDSIDSFIRLADDAMYAAKKAGRNRVNIG